MSGAAAIIITQAAIARAKREKRREEMEMGSEGPAMAVGRPVNNGTSNKAIIKARIEKIRAKLLTAEEVYYSYREDMESSLAETKFQLDKLEKFIGEQL